MQSNKDDSTDSSKLSRNHLQKESQKRGQDPLRGRPSARHVLFTYVHLLGSGIHILRMLQVEDEGKGSSKKLKRK